MRRATATLVLVAALAAVGLGGCFGPRETLTSVVQANRSGSFAIAPGQKVAVLTFTGNKGSGLADLMAIEFLRHGVDVVERNVLDRVVAEVRRTEGGLYDNDLSDAQILQQIGRITEADFVIFGESEAIDPDTLRYVRDDFGPKSPRFWLAFSRISVRAFSTSTGEVVWWGTCETTTQAPFGDQVRIMDHLRVSARRAVDSLLDPSLNSYSRRAERREVPDAAGPLVPYGTAPSAAAPPPPLPATPPAAAVSPAPTATTGQACSKDKDCPGELVCVKGACAAP